MQRVFGAVVFVAGCVLGVSAFNITEIHAWGITLLFLALMICSGGVFIWTEAKKKA